MYVKNFHGNNSIDMSLLEKNSTLTSTWVSFDKIFALTLTWVLLSTHLSRIQTWKKHSNKRQKIPKHLVFFCFFKKEMCFRKYWKMYYNNCLHNSKLMMSLTRFYQHQNTIPFIHRKKKKITLIQNRRESVDSKALTIQKLWQFFFFQEEKKGFWHLC